MSPSKRKATTCIEGQCNRAGIQVFDNSTNCKECGGALLPWEMVDFQDDVPEDSTTFDVITDRLVERAAQFEEESRRGGRRHSPPEDTFSCPADLTDCPIAARAKVRIPQEMYYQWLYLARQFDTEWIAYLFGHPVEGEPDTIEITGQYFPKQKANGVHCDAEEGEIRPGTIAAVHSHVGMDAFFSGEDKKHFNHAIELVVNRKGDIKANGRVKLECGRFHRGDAQVVFTGSSEMINLVEELDASLVEERIHSGTFQTSGRDQRTPAERRMASEQLTLGPFTN